MQRIEEVESLKKELHEFVAEIGTSDLTIQSSFDHNAHKKSLKRKLINKCSNMNKTQRLEKIKEELFKSKEETDKTVEKYMTKMAENMLLLEILLCRLNDKKK